MPFPLLVHGGKLMSEYLVLLKLNPGKLIDTLGNIRNLPTSTVRGVDICYAMNIFGAWDVGLWINAENSQQALEFVQKKVKGLNGVIEVYTVPTFPHGNTIKIQNNEEKIKASEGQKELLKA